MKKQTTNNIKYSKETGALKVLGSILASKRIDKVYKDRAMAQIERITNNYCFGKDVEAVDVSDLPPEFKL